MQTTESFGRGRIAEAITNTQTVPFTLSVSKVPNGTNQYITISPDTDNEEIFYYTTKTGTVGGVGTLNITGRGYYPHNTTQNIANYKNHSLNTDFKLALNHIIINGKVDYTDLASTSNTLGASLVGIEDSGTHFVGTTVEAALEELALGAPGVADASETVAGKVELSTDAELAAGTTIGGTTARLVPSNSNTTTTKVANKIPILNGTGKIVGFINSQADGAASETEIGLVEKATTAEVITGTDNTRYIAPDGLAATQNSYVVSGSVSSGTTTHTVTITHNLGRIPKIIRMNCSIPKVGTSAYPGFVNGTYNGVYSSVGIGDVGDSSTSIFGTFNSTSGSILTRGYKNGNATYNQYNSTTFGTFTSTTFVMTTVASGGSGSVMTTPFDYYLEVN